MKISTGSARYRWGFTLVVTNLAVLTVLVVVLVTGQIQTLRDFLHTLAYTLLFSNVTAGLGMIVMTRLVERFAQHRPPSIVPVSIAGFAIVVPAGCLAAQALLVALHLAPANDFWHQYLNTIKIATPLAVVFGLGALAYATLRTRLEFVELQLREKELAEERALKLAAEARLRSLESWIHPHFLFNTLNSISALIAVDPARAEQIVGRLATLLRAALDSGHHSRIPLRDEIALVNSYLDIERVRLGSRLRATVDVPAVLLATEVPPMSIQSLVANAVKYGIVPQPTGGEILITATAHADPASQPEATVEAIAFRPSNGAREKEMASAAGLPRNDSPGAALNSVNIAIRDSGPGFDLASIPAGHGLDKLVQRLDALYGDKAGISVSRRDGHCVVEMRVPASRKARS